MSLTFYQMNYNLIFHNPLSMQPMLLTQPNTLPTEPDNQPLTAPPTPATFSPPTSLILLLVFIILQTLLAIAVLVLKIVFNYYGFNDITAFSLNQTCQNYQFLVKYEANQLYILKISLVMVAVCILLSLIILAIISRAVHQSRNLPIGAEKGMNQLTISSIYLVLGPKMRALLYILQSICVLTEIVVLGYYLTYFIQVLKNSCTWNAEDTSTKIMVLWIICAALLLMGCIAWIIITMINLRNRADQVYQEEEKPIVKYQNINTTEMNSGNMDNTKKQFTNIFQRPEEKVEPINRVRTLDSEKEQYAIVAPSSTSNQKKTHYYHSPNTPKNQISNDPRNYENPVFKTRKELYDSPYQRIENGKYFQGDRDKNNQELKAELKAINEQDKEKEFRRSRFNSNPNEYESYDKASVPKEEDQYFRTLSRYRLEQEQKDIFKPQQSRQILPEGNRSPTGSKQFEGSNKPKLHSTYFKDETAMLNKKRYENSDEKKKRKGILTDYIRGKYGDN